ncbi:coiled-coil domain-containing protein 110 [Spea bombifrons]|uniref:coiled-coil domain-containing protein 110 n=1 Tax=Spea bombifrons TaxID=233779 RepID=UPI00234AC72C|nr:coiled-coil domain-containing protein 110 [Spea bombifrons]
MTQDAESGLTIEELNSTEIEEGSLTGESSSHIFGRQVVTSSITSNPEQHKDQAYHVVMKHKGDFVDHDNHSYICAHEGNKCSGVQVCPHKATIDRGSPCSCDGIRLYPDDVFTDTVEGRQQLDHIQKLQNRKGNLEENLKKLEVNEMTETNLADDVFTVLELERSVCKLEDTKIQLFRQENALLKKKLSQLQFDTQCLTEQNASFKGTINKLMEEKNIAELCLAQAEQDRELLVKEMNMVIEKCEQLVREKKHILSEKNHLTIEKQFMSKEIRKLKIGNWRMEEELAIITREKDKIANLVKSIHQDLLTHTDEKLQLQLKLRDALTENNQLKRQLAESKVQSSDPNESCLHLMKFHGNKTNPESDLERSVITPLGSSSEHYEPFFHDQLLHEIKNLKAKNLMLWTSFCENGQKCQFLSKLVHDLKNDNNMMNVDLEERAKTNAVLESKIKNLIEEKFSCEMWITNLENHKEMIKLKLYDLQGNLHRYREHISDDQIYKELLTRHHQEEGNHGYCELCQGIYNHQHKAKLLAVEANRNITAIQRLLMEECFQRDSTYKNPVSVLIPFNFTSSITAARRRSSYEHADARQEHTDAASLVSEHSLTNMSDFTIE